MNFASPYNNNPNNTNLQLSMSSLGPTPMRFANTSLVAPPSTADTPSVVPSTTTPRGWSPTLSLDMSNQIPELALPSSSTTASHRSSLDSLFSPPPEDTILHSLSSPVGSNSQPFTHSTQIQLTHLTSNPRQQQKPPTVPNRQLSVDIAPESSHATIVVATTGTNAKSVASLATPALKDLASFRGPKSARNRIASSRNFTKTPRFRSPANSIFSPRAGGTVSADKPQTLGAPTPRVSMPAPEAEKWDIFVPAKNLWMLIIAFSIHSAHDLMCVVMDASKLSSPI
jgi:hypothetical protein